MAKTIPQLTDATTVNAADELIIQQGGITKRATVSELMSGAVNAKTYGAKGDGVSDDTSALNAAIGALSSNGGGTLFLPDGAYRITSTILVNNIPLWIEGEAPSTSSTTGTSIIVDTANQSGFVFTNCDHGGIRKITIDGPRGSARLTGGALVEVGDGTFTFTIEDSILQRGYNGLKLYGGLSLSMRNTRVRLFSGDYCVGCVPSALDGRSWQGLNMVSSDTSAGDHVQYFRFASSRTFTFGAFINNAADISVTLVDPVTWAKTILTQGAQYSVTIGTNATTVVIDPSVSLTTGQYIICRRVGGLRGIGTTLLYCNGRTASHKIVNCTGGFGADGYWFTNTTQEGRPGAMYIANGGLENIAGDAIRIETGSDYKIANCYFSGEGAGLNVINDPAGSQNISNVFESPSGNKIRLTVTNHGISNPPTAGLVVSGVLGTDISQANGRFPVETDEFGNISYGYVVVDANTLELNYRLLSGNIDPVSWKQDESASPSWTPATGNARTRIAGTGDASVVNTFFRAARKSGVRINSGYTKVANCKVTTSGSGDKSLFGIQASSITDSAGSIAVTTAIPHLLEAGDLVRFEGLKLSGVTQLSYVYGSVASVVNATQVVISATGVNSSGTTVSMAYAGPYDAGTVLLIPSGANVEIGPEADDLSLLGNQLGDNNNSVDITPYGIWNKSAKTLQILDNTCLGVRRLGIRNDVSAVSAGHTQIWRGNITDQGVSSNLGSESITTAGSLTSTGGLLASIADGSSIIRTSRADNAATGPQLSLRKSRGTQASRATVIDLDVIGDITFQAFGGVSDHEGARIRARVDGTCGDADMPTSLQFFTTADGAGSVTERMRISNAGSLGVGTTAPLSRLHVAGDLTVSSATTATAATAGAETLPANPVGFLVVSINGTSRKIPYYAT